MIDLKQTLNDYHEYTVNTSIFERHNTDWRSLQINQDTYEFLEHMSQRQYNTKIKFIVLFGSVAREQAKLGSDIDIAVISDEALTRAELKDVHPDIDHSHFYGLDYRIINVSTYKLNVNSIFNVGYHIRREGVILYGR